MKIRSDRLRVRSVPYDDKGNRIEPEQQPAQRVLTTESTASMQVGGPVGKVPTEIIYETSAGELASAMRHPCFSCKHFDQKSWLQLYQQWSDPGASKEKQGELNQVRAAMLETSNIHIQDRHTGQDGDMDAEHALSQLGVCRPLSEIHRDAVIVHPTGTCPPEVCSPTQPHGLYIASDKEADKMGSATFDNVMRLATGKSL